MTSSAVNGVTLPDVDGCARLSPVGLADTLFDNLDIPTVHAAAIDSLRTTVIALIDLGAPRSELLLWAVAAGYSESHIRNLLSRLLRGLGGGGYPVSPPLKGRHTGFKKNLPYLTVAFRTLPYLTAASDRKR